jgi:GMP synthase (glutamine-hydrolysing)
MTSEHPCRAGLLREVIVVKPVLVLRHVPHEPLGTLENYFRDFALEFEYVDLFRAVPTAIPLEQAAALVILGGPMNVDEVDRYAFLGPELSWVRQAIHARMPVLGICLGAQLMAKALGARVYPNSVKEIGWYAMELMPGAARDPLFSGSQGLEIVFQWHGDTFDLPPGAVHLAQSEHCRQQAFRYGTSAYGFQFHIEMTPELVDLWLNEPGNRRELASVDYIDATMIRAQTPSRLPAMRALADHVLPRFARLAARHGK